MHGFKSFADPVAIELNDGITCIIGPNGSGKSNISDALRWVIGEQSSKQLRGSKMQDVIFAGTNTRKPKGMAEVTLVIDNSSGILPLEYNEVAVTRRMFRSGESEYLINGNQCRLKDIKELFMDTGIGVDGYSIIGQGKIAEIVSAKPDSRRQIFEEAAGVVLYKTRKSDAERKLKDTNANLERVRDIISEIESRIGGLKEDSEKATEYIGLRDRYKKLGVNIILHNLENLEKTVEAGRADLEELKNKVSELEEKNESFDELVEEKRVREAELSEELAEKNAELLAKIEELNAISNSGQLNEEKLSNIEKELERVNANLSDFEEKLEEEKRTLEEYLAKDDEISAKLGELNKTFQSAVIKYNEDNSKYNDASHRIEANKEAIISINNKNIARNGDIKMLENYKVTLSNRIEEIKAEDDNQGARGAGLRAELERFENLLSEKKASLEEKNNEIESLDDNYISVNNLIAELSGRINELNNSINRAEARMNTIEEMENNYEGYNNAVRAIMRKSFGGIIGTVSDLISVPSGYELAVETALGGALQNIVCKDDASAKSAINWLKSAKAGRATFLPVASVRADKYSLGDDVKRTPGYIGIASDIVSCKDYTNISDYLLCRVIIADNMDNAISISKKRVGGFRIVTLDGEIISSSGAITGGKYANKTANLLDRKKEIQELSDAISKLKEAFETAKTERDKARNELSEIAEKRKTTQAEYHELEIDFQVCKTDRDHAEELVKSEDGRKDKSQREIESIQDDIVSADGRIEQLRREVEQTEQESKALNDELELLIDEQEKLLAAREADNDQITSLRVQIGESETALYAQNELVERVRDDITDLEDSIYDNNETRKELEDTRNLLTSSGVESCEAEAVLKQQRIDLDARIKELDAECDKVKAEHDETLHKQKGLRKEIEEKKDESFKLQLRCERNETLLGTQKDKLWDDFEVTYAEAADMRDPDFAITAGNRESKEIKLRMTELGDVNISAIEEYKKVGERYEFLTAQERDTTKAMKELEEIISNMDRTIRTKFKETFDTVVVNFEEIFKELFGGGYAELRLEDETKPLESGIEITAQPPGKKLKNINLLSGGEKTLTAIALMFAVLKAKPTPFCILDEVEAALDEVNIERFSGYLKNFNEIQFALITHQKATMEHADVLYGVTMPEQGVSRMLSLRLGDDFDIPGIE